jgi:HSP20 family protein
MTPEDRQQQQPTTEQQQMPQRQHLQQPAPAETQSSGTQAPASGGSEGRYGVARRQEPFGLPSLFSTNPFEMLRRLDEDMERLFDQFSGGLWRPGRAFARLGERSMWSPQIELREQGGKLHLYADLPGLSRDDIKVDIEGDTVTIQGERKSAMEDRQEGYYRSERSYGSFYRTIPLPEGVDTTNAQATFKDGVLDISFDAPARQQRGRRLEIRDASSGASSSTAGSAAGDEVGSA